MGNQWDKKGSLLQVSIDELLIHYFRITGREGQLASSPLR
jgi:hypothetical protein